MPRFSTCYSNGFIRVSFVILVTASALFTGMLAMGNQKTDSQHFENEDNKLLRQFFETLGNNTIVFDASNAKQFWTDKSVSCSNDRIRIILNNKTQESNPLKVQLRNVTGIDICTIYAIFETSDCQFSVYNAESKKIASSAFKQSFINYNVLTASFSLSDTLVDYHPEGDFSFQFAIKSAGSLDVKIKSIILSFETDNDAVLKSPGKLVLSKDNTTIKNCEIKERSDNSFSVTGKNSVIVSNKFIEVTDNSLSSTITLKNTGKNATQVYVGYTLYSDKYALINSGAYPYNNTSKILTVTSVKDSQHICVDSYSDWRKQSLLAVDAKEDMSDIPNRICLGTTINSINQLEDGSSVIVLDKPLTNTLKVGTKLRVHSPRGASLYTSRAKLEPGEERVFPFVIKKDDNFLQFSSKAFSRGIYYVKPLVLSYSIDSDDNTILISDYSIEY